MSAFDFFMPLNWCSSHPAHARSAHGANQRSLRAGSLPKHFATYVSTGVCTTTRCNAMNAAFELGSLCFCDFVDRGQTRAC